MVRVLVLLHIFRHWHICVSLCIADISSCSPSSPLNIAWANHTMSGWICVCGEWLSVLAGPHYPDCFASLALPCPCPCTLDRATCTLQSQTLHWSWLHAHNYRMYLRLGECVP